MLFESVLAQEMANEMLKEGIYVIGFYSPVVPKGKARIRVQISTDMTKRHLDHAVNSFAKVGEKLGIIKI
jgi:glycine C-acetyltransferase